MPDSQTVCIVQLWVSCHSCKISNSTTSENYLFKTNYYITLPSLYSFSKSSVKTTSATASQLPGTRIPIPEPDLKQNWDGQHRWSSCSSGTPRLSDVYCEVYLEKNVILTSNLVNKHMFREIARHYNIYNFFVRFETIDLPDTWV